MHPIISIIVPVYNVENYLYRCLDSISAQTFTDFEVLLINDGSTDNSGIICEEYAQKDKRFKVFHKENGGVASARQLGIDKAIGEYSIHADGDDWMEKEMLSDMYKMITSQKADILITDFYVDSPAKKEVTYRLQKPSSLDHLTIIKEILSNHLFGSLWHKLIRHELYKLYEIKFCPNINYCEDVLVLAQLLRHPLSIAYHNKAYYHYCLDNTNSITRNYTKKTFQQRSLYYKQLRQIIDNTYYDKELQHVQNVVFYEAYTKNVLTPEEEREEIKKVFFSILNENYCGRFKLSLLLSLLKMDKLSRIMFPR